MELSLESLKKVSDSLEAKLLRLLDMVQTPKYFFSIHGEQFCLARWEKGDIHLKSIGTHATPLKLLSEENVELVTGLATDDVILRALPLKLKKKREILAALPFQVDSVLPLPQDELVLLPAVSEDHVVLLATTEKAIHEHLLLDADIVSCVPLALYRYARHYFPERENTFLEADNTLIVIKEGMLAAFQSIHDGDRERVIDHFSQKYPKIDPIPLADGPLFSHAIAIGLALDAAKKDQTSGQFRQEKNLSARHIEMQKKGMIRFFSLCAGFLVLTLLTSQLHLKKREREALTALGYGKGNKLSTVVAELDRSLYKQKKAKLSANPLPKISELLTWLSTHPKLIDCSIQRMRYELVRAPRLGTQGKIYSAHVEMEITTQNPSAARKFHEALVQNRALIDQRHDVKWNADHGIYHATFYLKPQSL